ncbi:competence protein ComK [Sporosarcina highlanderae]|uniref:Competence protein ComK n=1 Tax=Sporosarcina highlanderae TaxID=3035916 RepID=A0ABT8JLJ4_9BACL|nr:competence protein ComK [Sporosarcina highlanderae]MDN4605907.1 competence protein ComK [Sporosarcina highlanderae]
MIDDSLLLDHRALALEKVSSGKYLSKIITLHGIYLSETCPIELLNRACLRYHSTKKGRKEAVRTLMDFGKKPPFLISDEVGVFPTKASKHPDCVWIFGHFFATEMVDKKNTKLTFKNGMTINVKESLYTIKKQKLRLHTLLSHVQQSKRQYISEQPMFVVNDPNSKYNAAN